MTNRSLFACPFAVPAPRRKEQAARVVLALGEGLVARPIEEAFRRNGWDVHLAGPEADPRRVVGNLRPLATVLATTPRGRESGWLTCKKLLMERPKLKVVLVHEDPTARDLRLAEFVGAVACVPAGATGAVVRAVMGPDLPSAN